MPIAFADECAKEYKRDEKRRYSVERVSKTVLGYAIFDKRCKGESTNACKDTLIT